MKSTWPGWPRPGARSGSAPRPPLRPGPVCSARSTRRSVPDSPTKGGATTRAAPPEALAEAGLPESLAAAAESADFDEAIKKSHHEAFDEVGLDVGTPVVRIRGKALFGPVITPAPKGEAAGELWDGLVLVSKADGFSELKRSRDRKPTFD